MVKRVLYIGIWTTIIIILSLLPKNSISTSRIKLFEGADKIVHFFMYFVFMVLWRYASRVPEIVNKKKFIFYGLIFGALLGIILEILQKYLDIGRSFDIFDILANISGLIFVFLINKNFKDEF